MSAPFATPFELASALNHGHRVPCPDAATAAEVALLAGPGRPIRTKIERCACCSPTFVLERAQRWENK